MAQPLYRILVENEPGAIACRAGETVVAAMERLSLPALSAGGRPRIPVGCRRGGCGVCRVQVLAGTYRVEPMSRSHVSEEEQREGYALACRLVPESDLTLRLALRPPAGAGPAPSQNVPSQDSASPATA